MDFSLSQEQILLRDSMEKFVQNDYSFAARCGIVAGGRGYSDAHWQTFAELGWLGAPFAESDGGFGGGAVELMVMFEQLGKGLVVEPFLATVVLAGGAVRIAGTAGQKQRYLAGVIDGSLQGALAFAERQGRFNLADLTTTAQQTTDGFAINGHKAVVLNGPAADFLVVSARTAGAQRDAHGISLFVLPADAKGIEHRDYATVDGFRASEITFDHVEVGADALLGAEGEGLDVLEQVIDEGILAVGSEAVGCMDVLYNSTVDYCKTREQFGQPLGQFQVLQHRMVDMFMEYEQARSLMYIAAVRLQEGYGSEAQKAVSAFKVQVGRSGRFVGQGAVQLHGAIALTDEYHVGHYFKRVTMIDTLFGNVDFHLKRFGDCADGTLG